MEIIVREFCQVSSSSDPMRIEKLLNILEYVEALKLVLALPEGTLVSGDLSPRSNIKPYILDFINDERQLGVHQNTILLEVTQF